MIAVGPGWNNEKTLVKISYKENASTPFWNAFATMENALVMTIAVQNENFDLDQIINKVLSLNPVLTDIAMAKGRMAYRDIKQEMIQEMMEEAIPSYNPEKNTKMSTYVFHCAKMRLISRCKKYDVECRRRKSIHLTYFAQNQGYVLDFFRESHTRDMDLLIKAIQSIDFTQQEKVLLPMFLRRANVKEMERAINRGNTRVYTIREQVFRKIRIRYRLLSSQ
jgi:DNA-directed RNA polymerase specialized sigma24 family protein